MNPVTAPDAAPRAAASAAVPAVGPTGVLALTAVLATGSLVGLVLEGRVSWGADVRQGVGIAIIAAVLGLSVITARHSEGRRALVWLLIAGAATAWLVGDLAAWIHGDAGPSMTPIAWTSVAAYAVLLAGIALWLRASSWYDRVATCFDASLVVLATSVAVSAYVVHSSHWYRAHLPDVLVFVLATLTLAFGLSAFPAVWVPLWTLLIALGVAVGAVGDVLDGGQLTQVSPTIGHALMQGRGLILLLAVVVATEPGAGALGPFRQRRSGFGFAVGLLAVASTGAIVGLEYWQTSRHAAASLVIVGAAFGTLLIRLLLHAAKKHRDTQNLVVALEEQQQLAIVDALTGLYNRRFFEAALHLEVDRTKRSGGKIGILVVDLDHFKTFNDTYGHLVGDEVLRETARRLMRAIRTGDILARYGGEEFVVLLPGGGVEQLAEIGERCRKSVSEGSVRLSDGTKIGITASVGGASWPDNGLTVREVFDVADSALYSAKQQGRDRVELAGHEHERAAAAVEPRRAARPRVAGTRPQSCSPKTMAAWAALTARALGLDEDAQERCAVAARFHDVGKAVIPDGILAKDGPLNAAEWELLREHPDFGAKLVGLIPHFATAASVIREHHERFDGRGYPRGIGRHEISPEGQIVALCDAWVAMRSGRPYAAARTEGEARAELLAARGTQFDPQVVETFLMFDEASAAELDNALSLETR